VRVSVERVPKALKVEAQLARVSLEALAIERALIREQEIMHAKERVVPTLYVGLERRHRRRARVDVKGERLVPKDDTDVVRERREELLEGRVHTRAVGTLEVAEYDDGDPRLGRPPTRASRDGNPHPLGIGAVEPAVRRPGQPLRGPLLGG
jgi:hypothetical protein